jgi:hypothetical protein
VRTADKATHGPQGSLTVSFDQVTINNRTYPMRGTVSEAIESEGARRGGPHRMGVCCRRDHRRHHRRREGRAHRRPDRGGGTIAATEGGRHAGAGHDPAGAPRSRLRFVMQAAGSWQ